MDEIALLTTGERQRFSRDGFLVKPGFFAGAALKSLVDWCDEVTAWPEVPGRQMVYYEDDLRRPGVRVLQRVEDFVPYHAGFCRAFNEGPLARAVAHLLDEPVQLFKEKINYKLPGGGGFAPHQDSQAGWGTYAPYFITAQVSLDPADEINGCLRMAGGRSLTGLIGPEWEPLDDKTVAGLDFQPVETQPGDAIFFDSFAPHSSEPNRSDKARRVLYVTYNAASAGDHREKYFADKRRAYPPDIERAPGEVHRFRV